MDDNLDDNLLLLENGVDLVLQQAESWLDSAKIIINYMQKRSALGEPGCFDFDFYVLMFWNNFSS